MEKNKPLEKNILVADPATEFWNRMFPSRYNGCAKPNLIFFKNLENAIDSIKQDYARQEAAGGSNALGYCVLANAGKLYPQKINTTYSIAISEHPKVMGVSSDLYGNFMKELNLAKIPHCLITHKEGNITDIVKDLEEEIGYKVMFAIQKLRGNKNTILLNIYNMLKDNSNSVPKIIPTKKKVFIPGYLTTPLWYKKSEGYTDYKFKRVLS